MLTNLPNNLTNIRPLELTYLAMVCPFTFKFTYEFSTGRYRLYLGEDQLSLELTYEDATIRIKDTLEPTVPHSNPDPRVDFPTPEECNYFIEEYFATVFDRLNHESPGSTN